jgi:hypothetical protein
LLQAADRGSREAMWDLPEVLERAADAAGAHRLRRFGLTATGEIATDLDFGS